MLTNGCHHSNFHSGVIRVILIEVKPLPLLILKNVYGNSRIILRPLSSSILTMYRSKLDYMLANLFTICSHRH